MPAITIRIDDTARDELEQLAQAKETTVSALLREQIDILLGRGPAADKRADVPYSLSMVYRLMLAQQNEILARLATEDAGVYQRRAEALFDGYAGEYGDIFAGVQPELTRAECVLVWDLLDMFRILGASVDALDAVDREVLGDQQLRFLKFRGFDLSDPLEGRLLGYVRYLVRDDRWTELRSRFDEIGDEGNSHSPKLSAYRRMLTTYQEVMDTRTRERGHTFEAYHLDAQQLSSIAASVVHPTRRGTKNAG